MSIKIMRVMRVFDGMTVMKVLHIGVPSIGAGSPPPVVLKICRQAPSVFLKFANEPPSFKNFFTVRSWFYRFVKVNILILDVYIIDFALSMVYGLII